METENNTSNRILSILLKEPLSIHTATSLSKALNITRQGIWKTLNKLAESKLVSLESTNDTKTSTTIIKLNWDNPVTEKTLSLFLTKESLKQQRWRVDFSELKEKVHFLVLFGSILSNSRGANDIDLLAAVNKKNFKIVEEITAKAQQTQIKKIHLIDLTINEFNNELKKHNKAYIDLVKKGIILYGQDNFIQFIKQLQK